MTPVLLVLDGVLTVLAGAAVAGLVRVPFTLLERALLALVCGVVLGSAATFGLSLLAGLSAATTLAGPLWVAVLAAAAAHWAGNPVHVWRVHVGTVLRRWRRRPPVAVLALTALTLVLVALLYGRSVYTQGGNLFAGYETVWADWSQHLSTEASFAVGANLPPQNPLFSGTSLLYPFLPDFHAATLMTLGLDGGAALALGSGVMAVVLVLGVVALSRRLHLSFAAGVIAAAICVLGGGLGFIGVFADACTTHGFAASQCTLGYVVGHPGDGVGIVLGTLHELGHIVSAQPRAYDGLLTAAAQQPLPDIQWYTPLFAWWLPQRSMLYGFDVALVVLMLVLAARRANVPAWSGLGVAGVLVGVLPLVHAQTLFAVALMLLVLWLPVRRREWLALLLPAALIAAPRLAQIALAPHGAVASGDAYPYFEPGWEANASDHIAFGVGGAVQAVGTALRLLVTPQWWGFWLANLGVGLPVTVLLLLGGAARLGSGRLRTAGLRMTAWMPGTLLGLLLAAMVIFALCDVVVFQSWDWDNTKLLVYWYLVAGLLVGALVTHWWLRGVWRTVAAVLMPASMLLTGVIVVLRLLPWTPMQDSVTGPYTIASQDEIALAAQVAHDTVPGAVFLTFGRPNDPLLAVGGRISVLGYYGWLWSYGTDFGTRVQDVEAMYGGCHQGQACNVSALLHEYHVSYVEIDDRVQDSGAVTPDVGLTWWASQGYPIVARSQHITVYDVRGA